MNSTEPPPIPRDFLLKQIGNEINAAFVFIEAARKAYRHQQPDEAGTSLDKAVEAHQQVVMQVAESPVSQVRAIARQLAELREAIDWLRDSITHPPK